MIDALRTPQAVQAFIAGLFVAIGWLVAAWQNRRRDAALRAERVRDVQSALHAEIRVYTEMLESQVLPLYGAQVEGQILSQPGFFPVIPTENNDRIFSAIVDDIHILPFEVVAPVVRYYHQLSVIEAMIADLRALKLDEIGQARAAHMYRHYIEMKIKAIELGNEARLFIRSHLEGQDRAVGDLVATREKARLAESKAGLENWIASERLHRDGGPEAGLAISAGRNPAAGRSGHS